MRTDELIAALAEDAGSVRAVNPWRRCALAALAGAAVAAVILVAWLGLRPMGEAMVNPSFWMKAAYTSALALGALAVAARLARPGGRAGRGLLLLAAPLAAIVALAVIQAAVTPMPERAAIWLGVTWTLCPWRILALSIPVYAAVVLALRRLAPTEPVRAGAAAGLLAGAVGATVYGFYCRESAPAFVAVWYTAGVALSAALGALTGGRLLRW